MNFVNPFSYEAATNLKIEEILDWYVVSHQHGPLLKSNRNLFLFGERGSGKSMTLRYFSLEAEVAREKQTGKLDLSYLGIYVKCNSALIWKREYDLIKREPELSVKAALLSENILALWIARALVDQISKVRDVFSVNEATDFSNRLSYLINAELPADNRCLDALGDFLDKQLDYAQRGLAERDPSEYNKGLMGFNGLVLQLMLQLRTLVRFRNSHFMIMIDDAQDLYAHQREAVNSWIAYRDHTVYSLKVAVARQRAYDFTTANGSSILEIHDYSSLDLQRAYLNSRSDYAKFVANVLSTRLKQAGIPVDAKKFFPSDKKFERDIKECQDQVRNEYRNKYPDASDKQLQDYVYKHGRAMYFGRRSPNANKPVYAGLETITEISTGVTRNVLEIAWRAFDIQASKDRDRVEFKSIPAAVQSEAIFGCCDRLWRIIDDGLDKRSSRISTTDANHLKNFFKQLGSYFQRRLNSNISEPRVLSFVISEKERNPKATRDLEKVMDLAIEQTLLFARLYPSRDGGAPETAYTPNKLLWPCLGLDVVGQSGRASIKASELVGALRGKELPLNKKQAAKIASDCQTEIDFED